MNAEAYKARVDQSLAEIDTHVKRMMEARDLTRATQFSLRALGIRRSFYGPGSQEFESARTAVSHRLLLAASTHQAAGRLKECNELLAFVDSLSRKPVEMFPAVERRRQLSRYFMYKELMITRHKQGKDRSALSFGPEILALVMSLFYISELPVVHLNIAAVNSNLRQHQKALAHCFCAFQVTRRIVEHLDGVAPSEFIATSLQLEQLDRDLLNGADVETDAYDCFIKCKALHKTEMSEVVDVGSTVPSFEGAGVEKSRWGGFLALVLRSIAAEQEHLEQFAAANLTYKVAHITAIQCLGPNHPISVQCEQALNDAQRSDDKREERQSHRLIHKPSSLRRRVQRESSAHAAANRTILDPLFNSKDTFVSQSRPSDGAYTLPTGAHESRRRVPRPAWNQGFSASLPASVYEDIKLKMELRPPSRAAATTSQSAVSAVLDDSDRDQDTIDVTEIPKDHNTTSTTSTTLAATKAQMRGTTSTFPSVGRVVDVESLPPLTAADYSFVVNTYKLPFDRWLQRSLVTSTDPQKIHEREVRSLAAERKYAEALKASLGL